MSDQCVVLVEPEVPENTGFIARLCSNFDYSLRLVNPGFNLDRDEVRKTANNAQSVLNGARVFDSLEDAVEDLDFVVGTKPGKGVSIGDFNVRGTESIVLGRESSGLSNDELDVCDAVVFIDTSGYSSLNLSHAASVLMHHFDVETCVDEASLEKGQKELLSSWFGEDSIVYDVLLRSNLGNREFDGLVGELKEWKNS